MSQPEGHLEVTSLQLEGCVTTSRDLSALLDALKAQAKKRFVSSAHATLRFGDQLVLRIAVQERGARLKVEGRGIYACSVDGLLNAIADEIREGHGGDAALLDLYEALLVY
jgi:hypothetical protein